MQTAHKVIHDMRFVGLRVAFAKWDKYLDDREERRETGASSPLTDGESGDSGARPARDRPVAKSVDDGDKDAALEEMGATMRMQNEEIARLQEEIEKEKMRFNAKQFNWQEERDALRNRAALLQAKLDRHADFVEVASQVKSSHIHAVGSQAQLFLMGQAMTDAMQDTGLCLEQALSSVDWLEQIVETACDMALQQKHTLRNFERKLAAPAQERVLLLERTLSDQQGILHALQRENEELKQNMQLLASERHALQDMLQMTRQTAASAEEDFTVKLRAKSVENERLIKVLQEMDSMNASNGLMRNASSLQDAITNERLKNDLALITKENETLKKSLENAAEKVYGLMNQNAKLEFLHASEPHLARQLIETVVQPPVQSQVPSPTLLPQKIQTPEWEKPKAVEPEKHASARLWPPAAPDAENASLPIQLQHEFTARPPSPGPTMNADAPMSMPSSLRSAPRSPHISNQVPPARPILFADAPGPAAIDTAFPDVVVQAAGSSQSRPPLANLHAVEPVPFGPEPRIHIRDEAKPAGEREHGMWEPGKLYPAAPPRTSKSALNLPPLLPKANRQPPPSPLARSSGSPSRSSDAKSTATAIGDVPLGSSMTAQQLRERESSPFNRNRRDVSPFSSPSLMYSRAPEHNTQRGMSPHDRRDTHTESSVQGTNNVPIFQPESPNVSHADSQQQKDWDATPPNFNISVDLVYEDPKQTSLQARWSSFAQSQGSPNLGSMLLPPPSMNHRAANTTATLPSSPEYIPRSEPVVSGAESLLQEAYSKVHASECVGLCLCMRPCLAMAVRHLCAPSEAFFRAVCG